MPFKKNVAFEPPNAAPILLSYKYGPSSKVKATCPLLTQLFTMVGQARLVRWLSGSTGAGAAMVSKGEAARTVKAVVIHLANMALDKGGCARLISGFAGMLHEAVLRVADRLTSSFASYIGHDRSTPLLSRQFVAYSQTNKSQCEQTGTSK